MEPRTSSATLQPSSSPSSTTEEQTTDILIEIPELDGIRIIPGQEIQLYVSS